MRRLSLVSLAILVAVIGSHVLGQNDAKHDPASAVANLEVHPELEAQLVVSEPRITNPTNLDVDAKGRVWICDVVNYRGNNGKRPAGDRILILEDIGPDGHAGKVTTFYQGKDVDTAMGICVLGDKVIVSATPNILVFTKDENDKIVKKEALFTKSGQVQHDHSLHTFVFGPDGKYYWNHGNTGNAVFDKDGKPVVTIDGNVVNAQGHPYRQGMVFRCDPDGSHFEVLAHNFRNNYEVAVDSFGALWQSDNDDDGNRGVRINFVMEGGNFGYSDEMTGAGWQAKRTNMEAEIPLRHWHLNDPGVVPNMLQTGAGSPAGICVYEGDLLPKIFRGQLIHCDPGPSVCRAYIVTPKGAGYTASIVNILDGTKKNNWFRPVDVCTAPDGSLFVTDWYDPGVGGHAQRDTDRGRVFRVAPKGSKYSVPKLDFSTLEGAAAAARSRIWMPATSPTRSCTKPATRRRRSSPRWRGRRLGSRAIGPGPCGCSAESPTWPRRRSTSRSATRWPTSAWPACAWPASGSSTWCRSSSAWPAISTTEFYGRPRSLSGTARIRRCRRRGRRSPSATTARIAGIWRHSASAPIETGTRASPRSAIRRSRRRRIAISSGARAARGRRTCSSR